MACCVRGYQEYKDIEPAATGEVLACRHWCAVVWKIFVVKLNLCQIFLYVFCVQKYFFLQQKKSELRYFEFLAVSCHQMFNRLTNYSTQLMLLGRLSSIYHFDLLIDTVKIEQLLD